MFTSSTYSARKTFRWIVLLPVLMIGSMVYWSVAIGLGGLSLMAASALSTSTDTTLGVSQDTETEGSTTFDVGDGTSTITVHLEESAEPEDVNDNAGAAGFTPVTDDQQVAVPGPGPTSY